MLRLEPRAQASALMSLASPLIALVLTALLAALLFAALGKDPVRGLQVFFVDPLSGRRQVTEVLLRPRRSSSSPSAWRCATAPTSGTSAPKGSSCSGLWPVVALPCG
jgi:hypothetical protein